MNSSAHSTAVGVAWSAQSEPGRSATGPAPRPSAVLDRDATPSVVVLGPALDMHGGVSRCEVLIMEELTPRLAMQHIATVVDGSLLQKALVFLRALHKMRDILAAPNLQIIHIHFASRGSTLRKMLLAAWTLRTRHQLILHAHGGGFDDFYAGLPGFLQRRVCKVLRKSPMLLVLSQTWKEFYASTCGVDPGRIRVMRNPVRLPASAPPTRATSSIQFVFLGRMSQAKGTYDLVRAFAQVDATRPTRLVLAGDGEVEAVKALVQGLGLEDRVRVFDWMNETDRNAVLRESHVFVLPSYREGVPMAMLEAMAVGLPSIGTMVGGVPEVLSPDANGIAVEPGNVEQLATAMTRIASDMPLLDRLSVGALEHVAAFGVDRYGEQLESVYAEVRDLAHAPSPQL